MAVSESEKEIWTLEGKKKPQKEQRKLTVTLCNFDKLFIEISLFGSRLPIYTKENIPAMVAAFKGF